MDLELNIYIANSAISVEITMIMSSRGQRPASIRIDARNIIIMIVRQQENGQLYKPTLQDTVIELRRRRP